MAQAEKHYHAVQFYKDDVSLAATAARFLADGLKIGQPGVMFATPEHTAAITREMASFGLDVDEIRRTGELLVFDARKALSGFMVGKRPDPVLFKATMGGKIEQLCAGRTPCPIRAYGEMVDLLWQDGNTDGAIRLEVLWNQLASTHDFALLCGYAVGHFYKETEDPRFREVCDQHSHVVPTS